MHGGFVKILIPAIKPNDSLAGFPILYLAVYKPTMMNGVANAWNSGNKYGTSTCTNILGTNNATIDFTGVQLELALNNMTNPTPFQHIPLQLSSLISNGMFVQGTVTGFARTTTIMECIHQYVVPYLAGANTIKVTALYGIADNNVNFAQASVFDDYSGIKRITFSTPVLTVGSWYRADYTTIS